MKNQVFRLTFVSEEKEAKRLMATATRNGLKVIELETEER